MTHAIANSLANSEVTVLEYGQVSASWQTRINKLGLDSPEKTLLVIPENESAIAEIVKQAAQAKWQLFPCGNGSKLDWGGNTKNIDLVLSTQKCNQIIDHAVADLTVTVEAGITLKELQAQLQKTNQFLPIDPAFPAEATIGGILATADTGSWRQRYGGIRDLVLGISFVRGDGAIAKAGGRVVKNVAGYDLMKLFIGSYGTLGIITQVTFRTYPIQAADQTIVLTGSATSIAEAIKLLKNSGLTPTAADLVTPSVADALSLPKEYSLLVRFQTIPESIGAQTQQLKSLVKDLDIQFVTYDQAPEQELWQKLNKLREPHSPDTIICKIGILASEAIAFLEKLTTKNDSSQGIIHIGSGLGTIKLPTSDSQTINDLRAFCTANSGFLAVLTAPLEFKQNIDIWGYQGNALEMMQTIKSKFDPQGIFNSDRFLV